MKKTQKQDNKILAQVIIVIALSAIALFLMTLKNTTVPTPPVEPSIQTQVDLDNSSAEINAVNLDQIDSEIKKLDSDTADF